MTDSQSRICAKKICGHVACQHENADLSLGKCRHPRCRCRLFRPETMAELLVTLGFTGPPLPPDDPIYSSGVVVFLPAPPADEKPPTATYSALLASVITGTEPPDSPAYRSQGVVSIGPPWRQRVTGPKPEADEGR